MTIDELGVATVIPQGWTAQGVAAFAGSDASIAFGAGPSWVFADPAISGFELVATERLGGRTWDIHALDTGEVAVTWAQTSTDATTYIVQLEMLTARADEIIDTVGMPALEAFEVVDPDAVRSALTAATVEVDGRTVAYAAGGGGPTTVVFEAGLDGGMADWAPVADSVAESSRVFVYDRAGMGGSDPTDAPRDGHRMVTELRAVLAATGHEPPYVVVGHSLGGTLMELYARAFPEDVAGLVLVDSRPADFTARCVEALGEAVCLPPDGMIASEPEPVQAEWRALPLTEEQVLAAPPPSPVPAVVLVAGRSEERPEGQAIWEETQRRLAESLGASLVLDEEIGHGIQFERPELVLDAIDTVIRSVDENGTGTQFTHDTESEQP
ncbi:MAG: alpha/beta hydrolase [Acidimicrobiia bacterium]|nr:alpha/beta hydrolase [Acidimicrobiia bacterium]